MIARKAAAGLGAMALAACSMQAPPPPADPLPPPIEGATGGHTCDSTKIQQFVGRLQSEPLKQEMLRVSGASIVRWVRPGMAITMEFSPQRLTVYVDASDRVERISCS